MRSGAERVVRRLVVGLVGGGVLLAGVAIVVLPAPASLVIPAGLGILASEFAWARRLLVRLRARTGALTAHLRGRPPA